MRVHPERVPTRSSTSAWLYSPACFAAILALFTGAGALTYDRLSANHEHAGPLGAPGCLTELLALPPSGIGDVPTARVNLLCAVGLSPASETDVEQCLATLKCWAARVRSETERHWYRFERNPAEFEHSEGFFQMLMLAVVLAEDFQVHYDEQRRVDPAQSTADDGFFADPDTDDGHFAGNQFVDSPGELRPPARSFSHAYKLVLKCEDPGWPSEELGRWYWGVDMEFGPWHWTGTFYPPTSDVITPWPL